MKEIIKEFKKIYKVSIIQKLKQINKLDSEITKLYSEINKLYSEINKLYFERNKLYFERNKLYFEIFTEFDKFDKKHNLVVQWYDYDFKLEKIKFKYYNKDKTGFLFCDMKGNITEELFEKVENEKIIDGKKYILVED